MNMNETQKGDGGLLGQTPLTIQGEESKQGTQNNWKWPIREDVLADTEFMDGVRRGLEACKRGDVYPLEDVKRELGLEGYVPLQDTLYPMRPEIEEGA